MKGDIDGTDDSRPDDSRPAHDRNRRLGGRRRTTAVETPRTTYLEHDGIKIAWQVFGDGPAEMLFVPGWVSNVDLFWQYPQSREFFTELAAFARVALYDKPGTGASILSTWHPQSRSGSTSLYTSWTPPVSAAQR